MNITFFQGYPFPFDCLIYEQSSIYGLVGSGVPPFDRFMHTFDDGEGLVAEAKRSRRGHTCFA